MCARQDASGNLQATGSLPPTSQPMAGLQQGDDMGDMGSPHRRLASPHRRFFISSPVRGMVSPMRGMVQFTGATLCLQALLFSPRRPCLLMLINKL